MLIELNEDTLQNLVATTNKVVVQYSFNSINIVIKF